MPWRSTWHGKMVAKMTSEQAIDYALAKPGT
jgi:hypothetical protein